MAGLAGLFGRGPLAKAIVEGGDGTEVHYERIARNKTPALVEIRLPRSAALQSLNGIMVEIPRESGQQPGKVAITQDRGVPGKLWNRITFESTGTQIEFSQIVLP